MIISSLGFYNLILLIVTTALLLVGAYAMKYKRKTIPHAAIMTVAWVLTVISVLVVMVPSTIAATPVIAEGDDWRFIFLFVHHLVGLVAVIAASVLALSWLIRGRRPNSCLGKPKNKKLIMLGTFYLWLLSLILGLLLWDVFA